MANRADHSLTITASGHALVPDPHIRDRQRRTTLQPEFIFRHYGSGTTAGAVTIGGVKTTVVGSWSERVP